MWGPVGVSALVAEWVRALTRVCGLRGTGQGGLDKQTRTRGRLKGSTPPGPSAPRPRQAGREETDVQMTDLGRDELTTRAGLGIRSPPSKPLEFIYEDFQRKGQSLFTVGQFQPLPEDRAEPGAGSGQTDRVPRCTLSPSVPGSRDGRVLAA